jgi:hypothetical protein
VTEPLAPRDDSPAPPEPAPETGRTPPMVRLFARFAGGAMPADTARLTALGDAFQSALDGPDEDGPARDS